MRGLRLAGARGWVRENGLPLLLCAAVVLQTGILVRGQILPLVERVRQVWSMPALERSGRLAFGDAFWEYIDFIRRTVPEDAIVIIPPEAVDVALGSEGIMRHCLMVAQRDPDLNKHWCQPVVLIADGDGLSQIQRAG